MTSLDYALYVLMRPCQSAASEGISQSRRLTRRADCCDSFVRTQLVRYPTDSQRLQHEEREHRTDPVKRYRHSENGHPASRGRLEDVPEWDE